MTPTTAERGAGGAALVPEPMTPPTPSAEETAALALIRRTLSLCGSSGFVSDTALMCLANDVMTHIKLYLRTHEQQHKHSTGLQHQHQHQHHYGRLLAAQVQEICTGLRQVRNGPLLRELVLRQVHPSNVLLVLGDTVEFNT